MKQVSEAYKESMAKPLRNRSHVRVLFNNNDATIPPDGQWVGNNELGISNTKTIDYSLLYGAPYATLEINRWTLDGSFDVAKEDASGGFIASEISNGDGEMASPVVLTREFSKTHTIPQMSIVFDSRTGVNPESVLVDFYLDGRIEKSFSIPVDGDSVSFAADVSECDKITITFGKLPPYRRARLESITYGVQNVFFGNEIESTKQNHDIDPLSRRLPKETMQFTILDYDRKYDPDNPSGIWKYVAEKSSVAIQFGYELPNGLVEWVAPDNYTLDGRPAFSNNRATFKATGFTGRLSGKYYKGSVGKKSFYALAEEVLQDAELPPMPDGSSPWVIDESLKTMYTTAAMPIDTHANCLQLIAHACGCTLRTNDENIILIERFELRAASDKNFNLLFDSVAQNGQTMAKIDQLKAVNVHKTVYKEEDTSVIYQETTDEENIHIEFSAPASNVTVTVSGGTLISSKIYARAVDLVLSSGSKTITIKGNTISEQSSIYSFPVSSHGSVDEEKNPLITNNDMCVFLANHIAKYLQLRNTYDVSYRGNPEVECGDLIAFQTMYTQKTGGLVLTDEITFNGTLKGKLKIKAIGAVGDPLGAFILGYSALALGAGGSSPDSNDLLDSFILDYSVLA